MPFSCYGLIKIGNNNVEDSHWFKLKKRCLLRLSWKSGAANSPVLRHRCAGSDRKSPQRDGTKFPKRTEVRQMSSMNLGCSLLPIFFSSYNMDLPLKMKCPLVYLLGFHRHWFNSRMQSSVNLMDGLPILTNHSMLNF